MDHSLVTAGRTTHLKIVFVALVGAILVVVVGIVTRGPDTKVAGPVIKPTNSLTFTPQNALFH